jgi:hypothetical protein
VSVASSRVYDSAGTLLQYIEVTRPASGGRVC